MPGEGGVYQRRSDGRWVAAYRVGPRGASVKHVRYLPLRETKKGERHCRRLAEKLLEELIADVHGGRRRAVPTTLGDFLERWHEVYATKVGASQATSTMSLMRNHIIPALGDIELRNLTPSTVEQFLSVLPLSSQSKRHTYNLLAKALDTAVRDELAPRNVVRLIDPPSVTKVERRPWSLEEAAKFLEAARGDRYFAAYLLGIVPGLRQAEILGLAWGDVDLDMLSVRVAHQLQRQGGEYVLTPTKTKESSTRAIAPGIADALREHRRRQIAERLAAHKETEDGLVFVTPQGRPVNGSWLLHHFQKLSEAAGVRVVPFHSLRHLAGTLMAGAGVGARVAQAQLGHRNVSTTLGIYTHVVGDQQGDAALRVAGLLGLEKVG